MNKVFIRFDLIFCFIFIFLVMNLCIVVIKFLEKIRKFEFFECKLEKKC
jgi:hypothetical protein